MKVHKAYPKNKFYQVENAITCDKNMSNGAHRLYCFYMQAKPNIDVTDEYVSTCLGFSVRQIKRWRKELMELGLFQLEQVGTRVYVGYIGDTTTPPKDVKGRVKKIGK